jgi:hypothetical protein
MYSPLKSSELMQKCGVCALILAQALATFTVCENGGIAAQKLQAQEEAKQTASLSL